MNQAFDAVLEVRFRQCPGHQKITRKEYALRSNPRAGYIERTVDFRQCFYPGQRVEMILVFKLIWHDISVCPGCNFQPPKSEEDEETVIEWYNCLAPSLVQCSHIVVAGVVCGMSVLSSH